LTGCRPGEGSRIRLNDIDTDARMFVIRNAKAGKDIHLPITPEIAFAISLAVNAEVKPHHEVKETDLVFPGCRQISQRAALPSRSYTCRGSAGEDQFSSSSASLPKYRRAARRYCWLRKMTTQ
jgi:integrase